MSDPGNPDQPYGQVPPPPPPPPGYPAAPPPYGADPYANPDSAPPGYPPAYGGPTVPYAHWGLRVGAALLDGVLLLPFYVVAVVGLVVGADPVTGDPTGPGLALTVLTYVAAIAFMIWNQIVRQGRTGSSLGKQWVGITVVHDDNGRPLGGWLTFGRTLLHVLDQLACYVGYLWPLWDAKRQTFADKIVKSVVLRTGAPVPPPAPWPQQPRPY